MPAKWQDFPLDRPLYANVDADAVVGYQTAVENGYLTELKGQSRFPGLDDFATLDDNGRVYLHDLNGDLVAATSKGQVYRVDQAGNVTNVTGVPVSGSRRVILAKTNKDLLMAAGGSIVRLRSDKTELLSKDAPLSTHVGWIDGYALGIEIDSGRLYHSAAGIPESWDPLDTFAADGNPDNINSMIITGFREILLGGQNSIEQFERVQSGDVPFFRRWSVGDGVSAPYAMIFADNTVWTINNLIEAVRFAGQTSQAVSEDVGALLEAVDDWTDAWIGGYPDRPLHIRGHKFIVLQMPHATNPYGTKGITLLLDYKRLHWSELYDWSNDDGVPTRWPGWSHWTLWGRHFVGGEGKIYEISKTGYQNAGSPQRWLVRTSVMAVGDEAHLYDFRLQIKRGVGTSGISSPISVRCSRDGAAWSNRVVRNLGVAGNRNQMLEFGSFGIANTFQFEITTSADCPVELIKAQYKAEEVGH